MKIKAFIAGLSLVSASLFAAEPGELAPEFTLADLSGTEHSLSDFRGKYVVLEWFNAECPFVKKHYRKGHMQALQELYTGKDVVWLNINSTNPEHRDFKDAEASAKVNEKWNVKATATLLDKDGSVGRSYAAKTTPHMYVINPEGVLIYQGAIDNKPSTSPSDIEGAKNYVATVLDAAMEGKDAPVTASRPYGCSVKYN